MSDESGREDAQEPDIELKFGNNYLRVTDEPTRIAAVLFVVHQLDLTPDEVRSARTRVGMDAEDETEADDDE